MKRFIKYISFVAVPIIILLIVGEIYVEGIPNPARDKHRWMRENSDCVKTLILGSSHSYYGVRPDVLGDSTFSLALPSQTYRYDDYLLHHYKMKNLKNIVLTYSYFSMWEDLESQPGEEFLAMRYRIYMDCDIHPRWGWYGFEFMSIPSFKEKLKSIYQPARMTWDSLGWGSNYTKELRNPDWDNGKERAMRNTYKGHDSVFVLNKKFLSSIIDYCEQNNVRLYLISTPLSDTFIKNKNKRQDRINKVFLSKLLEKHSCVEYLDFESDSRFTADDFYDSDHLNSDGATKLTVILKKIVGKL